jgi:hypothetical protein
MEQTRKLERRGGLSERQYVLKLAANKRYRQRHPEKMREYKKRARERAKLRREQGGPGWILRRGAGNG